jgi:hypothetical protein
MQVAMTDQFDQSDLDLANAGSNRDYVIDMDEAMD